MDHPSRNSSITSIPNNTDKDGSWGPVPSSSPPPSSPSNLVGVSTSLPLTPRSRTTRRDQVARELMDSERTFVEQMTVLTKVFINPLRWWKLEITQGRESMHPPLPDALLQEIFGNVEQLLVFNAHVVEQFAELHCGNQAFGGFFKKAAPFFKMYSSYVSNYDRAMETLLHLIETRLDFAAFVRACELQEGCKGLNLRAYLIMPVQRIPRYKLLLTELLKHTSEDHPDYEDLEAAVKLVSGVVGAINEDIKRQERRFKVIEIQEQWDTVLVTASRKFEKEGPLIKVCRKGPKTREFVLFNDLLIYGVRKMASSEKRYLHRKLDLGELFVVDSGEAEKTFVLATRSKSFVVQCVDMAEKKSWMAAFTCCFAEMEKTVLYGKNRTINKDHRLTHVGLWMVREGEMVRESYLMPPDMPKDKTYGFLSFQDLRLIVDPQEPDRSSMGKRVLSRILRRGASLSRFNFKVQSGNPVPCEHVSPDDIHGAVDSDDDDEVSTYSDALSPCSSASASPYDFDSADTRWGGIGVHGFPVTSTRTNITTTPPLTDDATATDPSSSTGVAMTRTGMRRASLDTVAPGALNDVGFQTASGFIDGRQSSKWSGILSGLRPQGANSTSPKAVPDLHQEKELAALERSLGLMGFRNEAKNGGHTNDSKPPQARLSPPPLVDTAASAPTGATAVPSTNTIVGGGVAISSNSSSNASAPGSLHGGRPPKPISPPRSPLSPPISPRLIHCVPSEQHHISPNALFSPAASFSSESSPFTSYANSNTINCSGSGSSSSSSNNNRLPHGDSARTKSRPSTGKGAGRGGGGCSSGSSRSSMGSIVVSHEKFGGSVAPAAAAAASASWSNGALLGPDAESPGGSSSRSRRSSTGGPRPAKAPRSPRFGSLSPPARSEHLNSDSPPDVFSRSSSPLPHPDLSLPPPSFSSTASSYRVPGNEYVVVLPVSDLGLGIFLRDENGKVLVGGFRSPKNLSGAGVGGVGGAGGGGGGGGGHGVHAMNPSMRAGIRLGDSLLKVNGTVVHSVSHTIAVLGESRMEKVIALTLRRGTGVGEGWPGRTGKVSAGAGARVLSHSPPKPQSKILRIHRDRGTGTK